MSLIQDALKRQEGSGDDDGEKKKISIPEPTPAPPAPEASPAVDASDQVADARPVLRRKTAVTEEVPEADGRGMPPSQLIQKALSKPSSEDKEVAPAIAPEKPKPSLLPPPSTPTQPATTPPPTPPSPPTQPAIKLAPTPPPAPVPENSQQSLMAAIQAAPPPPPPSPPRRPETDTEDLEEESDIAPEKSSKIGIMVAGVVVVAVLLIGGVVWALMNLLGDDSSTDVVQTTTTIPVESTDPSIDPPAQPNIVTPTPAVTKDPVAALPVPVQPTPAADAPLAITLRQRIEHGSDVEAISISPSGSALASVVDRHTVALWNPDTGREASKLEGDTVFAYAVRFDNSSKYLIMNHGKMRIWDYTTQAPVQQYDWTGAQGSFDSIDVSSEGSIVALGATQSSDILLWSINANELIRKISLPSGSGATDVALSLGGRLLAVGGQKHVQVFTTASGKLRYSISQTFAEQVAFSPDGKFLAHLIKSENIGIVDADTGTPVRTITNPGKNTITELLFSGDGKYLFASSWDGFIYVWDFTSGKLEKKIKAHDEWITCMSMSADGRTLASGSYDNTIAVWSLQGVAPHSIQAVSVALDEDLVKTSDPAKTPTTAPIATAPVPVVNTPVNWPALTVGGFMGSGNKGAVIINKEVHQVGGDVEGVLIKAINGRSVVLEFRGEERVLKAGGKTKP